MTVRFLVGPAGSGKTHRCLARLRACERAGRPAIYLVPEQFTYSADRELLAEDDPIEAPLAGLRHVRVLSFSRLAWWLHERAGVAPPSAIDPAVRPMVLRAVLARMSAAQLGPLATLQNRHGLLEQLGRFVGEVRNHGAADFLAGLRGLEEGERMLPAVSAKLRALGSVFEAYDGVLRDRGRRDPEEHLHGVLPLIAAEAAFLGPMEIFVDGFLSWTRRESEVLVALARTGATLEIALCRDDANGSGEERLPFRPVARSLERLRDALRRAGVAVDETVRLPADHPTRFRSSLLATLERRLYLLTDGGPGEREGSGSEGASASDLSDPDDWSVAQQSAIDPYHEVQTWARTIDRWLRLAPRPLRPEEVAVFVRDVERYRSAVVRIFPRFGIDFFLDERRSILAHPQVRLVLGALDVLLSGWRRTSVVSLLRNPCLRIAPARVDLLENLSLELGRNFERWHDEHDWEVYALPERTRFSGRSGEAVLDPLELPEFDSASAEPGGGEGEGEEGTDRDDGDFRAVRSASGEDARERLDAMRRRVLLPLRDLERGWKEESWSGRRVVAALEDLLQTWIPERDDAARPSRGSHLDDPAWDRRVEEGLALLLAELGELWSDFPTAPEEVERTLREGLLALRLGVTPLRQGQVLIADVQRSRVEGIRAAIVGGVNEGIFPRVVSDDPILGDRDRRALDALGLRLGPSAAERQEEEAYLFYIAMTRASERLLVTYSTGDADGSDSAPSFLVAELARLLPGGVVQLPPEQEEDHLPLAAVQSRGELGPALLARLRATVGKSEPLAARLRERTAAEPSLAEVTEEVQRGSLVLLPTEDRLPEELLGMVLGEEIDSSVTRLQEFATCPFRSFAGGMLRLEPRPEARITPLETGTLAHRALELFFSAADLEDLATSREPDPLAAVTIAEPGSVRARLDAIFVRLGADPKYRAFQVDEASRYRWTSTRRSLERYLYLELARLGASDYRIRRRELPFGLGAEPGLELPLPEGRRLRLRGKIDRLDVREETGRSLALVVDYKRSGRSGLPASLERGTDLQLGAYLLYIRDVLGLEPAGGLYVPVLPSPPRDEKTDSDSRNPLRTRAHGFFLREERDRIDGGTDLLVRRGDQQLPDTIRRDALLATAAGFLRSYAHNQRCGLVTARPLQTEPSRLPCDRCEFPALCRYRRERDPRRRSTLEGMEVVS